LNSYLPVIEYKCYIILYSHFITDLELNFELRHLRTTTPVLLLGLVYWLAAGTS